MSHLLSLLNKRAVVAKRYQGTMLKLAALGVALGMVDSACAAEKYWKLDGVTATWTSSNWGTTPTGPFSTGWVTSPPDNATFNSSSPSPNLITYVTTTAVGNVTVNANTTVTSAGTLTTGGAVRTVTVADGTTLTWQSQAISTAAGTGFIKSGNGTWDMTGESGAYPGGLTLNAGTLIVANNNALGNSSLIINGGTLSSSGTRAYAPTSLTIGGDFTFAGSGNATIAASVNLGGATRAITNSTSGSLILTGLISGNTGVGMTFSGTGAGTINLDNTGNTFSGAIAITGAEVVFAADGSFGTVPGSVIASAIVLDGGRMTAGDGSSYTLNANRGIQVGSTAGTSISAKSGITLTYNGIIADKSVGGILAKQGSGTLLLGGVDTYSGATFVNNGIVRLTNGANRLPVSTTLALGQTNSTNVGTFDLNGCDQQVAGLNSTTGLTAAAKNSITNSSGGTVTLTLGGSGSYAYGDGSTSNSGIVAGPINLVKTGSGIQTLGDTNTYTGTTTISQGTLALSGGGSIANTPVITIAGGATFNLSGLITALTLGGAQALAASGNGSTGTIATTASRGLTLGATSPLLFTAFSGSTPPLTVTGAGSLTLAAGNAVTVTVANAASPGTPLAAATRTYKLVSSGSGNTTAVAGTAPSSVTVIGDGIVGTPTLEIYNGELYLNAAVSAPGVAVLGNGLAIANNASSPTGGNGTDFGNAGLMGVVVTNIFAITNNGTLSLTLGTVSSTLADFSIVGQPASSVTAGATTSFQVAFAPTAAGLRQATLSFTNNATNYAFAVQGQGVAAGIACSPASLSDSATVGSSLSQAFTITNVGLGTLSFTIASNAAWLSATPSAGALAAGAGQTIAVQYTTAGLQAGTSNATLTVSDADASNSPQTVAVQLTLSAAATAPSVNAPSSAAVGTTNAMLGGTILNTNGASVTEWGVYYSPTPGFGAPIGTRVAQNGTMGNGVFAVNVTGLSAGNTYYFQAYAVNGVGTNYTVEASVTLVPAAPVLAAARAVTSAGFTVNWAAAAGATNYFLDVSTNSDASAPLAGYNNLAVGNVMTYPVTGLTPSTTYYYQLRARNAGGTSANSSIGNQATLASAPLVTTAGPIATNATGATLGGNVTADGGATVTNRGVCYKTSVGVAVTDNPTACASNGLGSFTVDVTGLSANALYYFAAYAMNSAGVSLGAETNFYTYANTPNAPTVGGATASSLTVVIGSSDGNPTATTYAVYETNSAKYVQANGTLGTSAVCQTAATWGTKSVTGLAGNTTYTFEVQAQNGAAPAVTTTFGPTAGGTTLVPTFTAGNLMVFSAAASANNTTFSILEVSSTTADQASPVNAVSINGTNGVNALRCSGSASSTGYMSDSDDGTLLLFTGHNSTNGVGNANAISSRGVGTLNQTMSFTLATTYTGGSGNQTRCAASTDNVKYYIGDQGGIYTNGTTGNLASGSIVNWRGVKAFGGTVYAFTASASAVPVSTLSPDATTATALPGLGNGATTRQDFYLVQSGANGSTFDILYILDASGDTAGTIYKYSLVSGVWTANGTYTTTFGGFGLCAVTSGGGAILYVTTGQGAKTANNVLKVTDTAGYNAAISITTASNVTLYTAAAGTIMKGIAFAPRMTAPKVTASAAASIGATTATFNGNVTADGGSPVIERGFCYKTNSGVAIGDNQTTVAGTTGAYTLNLSSLSANIPYYFAAYAINAIGTNLSSEQNFYTLANAPTAPTVNGATTNNLNVAIAAGDGNPASTTYAIFETSQAKYVQADGSLGIGAVFQTTNTWGVATVTGLNPNQAYTFTAKALNGASVTTALSSASAWYTLAATPGAPVAGSPTANSLNVAIASGDGNPTSTTYAILETSQAKYVQADGSLGLSAVFLTASAWSTKTVTGLTPSQTYTFEAEAQSGASVGTAFGPAATATTAAAATPAIRVTPAALSFGAIPVNGTSANATYTVAGTNLTADITIAPPAAFEISTNGGASFVANPATLTLTQAGGLVNDTTVNVHFKPTAQQTYGPANIALTSAGAVAQNVAVDGVGANAPSVSTQAPAATNTTGATLSGTVTANNGAAITDRGFFWKTAPGVTTSDTQLSEGGTITGAYTKVIASLSVNTVYYYRSYATNAIGLTLDSADTNFWTLANVPAAPTVVTVSRTSFNIAINANGNPPGTTFAIHETISNKYVQTDGTLGGSPVFQSAATWGTEAVTGLNAGTRYTFEVFAQNGVGATTVASPSTSARTLNPPFTAGNLAVFQSDVASANNTTFSILELNPSLTNQTTTISSNGINGTTMPTALRQTGSGSSSPLLSDSSDGTLLVFAGFNGGPGSGNVTTNLQRGVGTLDVSANYVLQTTYTGVNGNQTRGATSTDNVNWYIGDQGGIYTNNASAATATGNSRGAKSFGGTAYFLRAGVGTSVSALSGSTLTPLPGLTSGGPTNETDFCMMSSGSNGSTFDVLYIMENNATATTGYIYKYSLVGGTWTANGTYATPFGGFGLCAAANGGGGAVLYATSGTGATAANQVVELTDSAGYNAPVSITTASNVTLYTASAGATLKGIAFAPVAAKPKFNGCFYSFR